MPGTGSAIKEGLLENCVFITYALRKLLYMVLLTINKMNLMFEKHGWIKALWHLYLDISTTTFI